MKKDLCPNCGQGKAEITCELCGDIICPECSREGIYNTICANCVNEDKEINSEEE